MEKEVIQKKLLRLVHTLYEVDVIEDEARNRLVYFAMNNLTTPTDTEKLLNADLTINGIYQILGQFGEEHEPIKKKFREYCETLTKNQNQ